MAELGEDVRRKERPGHPRQQRYLGEPLRPIK